MSVDLIHGDCRTIMPAHGPFDMIMADPPYGDTSLVWDRRLNGWQEIARETLKITGSMWVFGSMRFFMTETAAITSAGFRLAQDVVWEKHNGSGLHADRFKRVHEHIVQFYRDDARWGDVYNEVQTTDDATARTVRRKNTPVHHQGRRAVSSYRSEDGGPRIMRSVIHVPSCHGHAIHPTEKPVDLLEILVRTSCPIVGTVGDFFAGSASCAEACVTLGRNYVGCETDLATIDRAKRRSLFVVEALSRGK